MKNIGTILMPATGNVLLTCPPVHPSTPKTPTAPVSIQQTSVNTGYITTLRNLVPPQNLAPVSQQQAHQIPQVTVQTPAQTATPTVLTNLVFKAPASPAIQTAPVANQNQIQTVNQNQGGAQQVAPKTIGGIQYILPSFTVQHSPNGKVQNILQLPLQAAQFPGMMKSVNI